MKKIFFAIIGAVSLVSCTSDLDQHPITDKESAKFLTTETEVEEYVVATYASLQANGLYGLYLPAMGEVPSDNTYEEVPANDGAIYGDLEEFKTVPSNGMLADNWKASYVTIQRCNVVLNRIAGVSYKTDAVKNSRIGEMKFIRALIYFNMVQFYGDVPLTTDETKDPNVYFGKGRQPAADVYKQIIQDLTDAISTLPTLTTQQGRVIKTAAQTLLGKVYLVQKDYANAKIQIDAVVNSGAHALFSDPTTLFDLANENASEFIFSVQFGSGINSNTEGSTMAQQFSPSGLISGAKGHSLPTKELYGKYVAGDKRKDNYVKLSSAGTPYNNKLKKPVSPTPPADGGSNTVVLRYADVLLMQAEIENELGNTLTTAKPALDKVRNRAGLAPSTALTQADLRDAIELERRLELIGEGYRWLDLLRTGKAISTMNAWFISQNKPTTVTPQFLLMPIPQNQRDADPTITQNKDYQ
ncbi:RagB/SusD domain-containing protein [Flavobacterium sp. 90]|uniref:RagB/SusD family nutrient uptake outer membrane protein n=1 Tax=unclassified Flavobacterium TaxID=196869 RepID=UPI000EAED9B3|nr:MULTISPECIES: RagB/SusD family nutrient uptake outer membrane protein [unclassified Flavobacterium]RKR05044.1 RagB/SusD domain-containing protein [Flavobacterium sp. 81]TCK56360.1 RagB/SusD domain-containing protein [Flavobacterium sp. 90]